MPRVVPLRGVIEGFYGPPWSTGSRRATVELLGAAGMNAYVYAPKDDAKHRAQWREPYRPEELGAFRTLVGAGAAAGVRVGYAISPGLDVDYRARPDRAALLDKLRALADAGISWFVLALDDIPLRPGLAAEQADLAAAMVDALGTELTLCPTEYVGTRPTTYLSTLAAALPPAVQVMWTGPTVCSPTIRAADADAWAAALGGRRPILWDNYPVNDATMSTSLHLGPYEGREPALTDAVDGVLLNPMTQPGASAVALLTAAAVLSDPAGYDPEEAWRDAIDRVGGAHAGPLGSLARACTTSALRGPERVPLRAAVDELEAALAAADDAAVTAALGALTEELLGARHATRDWPVGDALGAEVRPWLDALAVEGAAGLAALRVVSGTRSAAPDAETLMQQAFLLLFHWQAAREQRLVAYGPRFAVYAAVVQLADGAPGLDVDAALVEDGSAIDRLCRVALAAYRAWTARRGDGTGRPG
jgi:hyaluronoglucosaminidase